MPLFWPWFFTQYVRIACVQQFPCFIIQIELHCFKRICFVNSSTHTDFTLSRNLSRCYVSIVPMVRMSGTGYLIAGELNKSLN